MSIEMSVILLDKDSEIGKALDLLAQPGVDVIFLVEGKRLVASLTNGDIRRGFAKGATNKSKLMDLANLKPLFVRANFTSLEIYKLFQNGVTHLPILNSTDEVVEILDQSYQGVIPISEPNIGPREIELVNAALTSNWISSSGVYIEDFERMFANFIDTKYSLAVSNGTQAIALALLALGIMPGDEVIVPSLTFGATANAVIQIGAVPVFIDIEEDSYAINPSLISTQLSSKTRAIIIVHLYGKPARLTVINEIAKNHNLLVIEDCAEAIGTYVLSNHVGSITDAGTFSFFANKTITTGEGGMVTFKSEEVYEKAKLIRSHGFDPVNRYWHKTWGTNMRLTNLQAAIGVAQLERIDELISKKLLIAEVYNKMFSEIEIEKILPRFDFTWGKESFWLYTIEFEQSTDVEAIVGYLANNQIETRRIFHPLPIQPAFETYNKSKLAFPVAKKKYEQGLCLPSSTNITERQIQKVVQTIAKYFSTQKN